MKQSIIWLLVLVLMVSAAGCRSSMPEAENTLSTEPEVTDAPEKESSLATEVTEETEAPTEPELYIEFSREGEVSRVPVKLTRGTVGSYTVCYDPERFTQEGDVFRDHVWGDRTPIVYYAIGYHPDMTAEELAEGLLRQYEGDFDSQSREDTTVGQYDAIGIYFGSDDALMTQQHFFAVDAPQGGAYLLETQFVMEMYEGLYPQIRAALDTFTMEE